MSDLDQVNREIHDIIGLLLEFAKVLKVNLCLVYVGFGTWFDLNCAQKKNRENGMA